MSYLFYFGLTFVLSTLFALGGVGSATALVPILSMSGISFDVSKAIGLFVNTSTTVVASIMNFKRKVLDIKFTIPLAVSLLVSAPIGAYLSSYVDERLLKYMLSGFLFFSASMMLFGKKTQKVKYTKKWVLYVIGSVVGVFSGMIGVGGGSLILPILILLGYDAKKMAVAVSFIIPFSTFSAFLMYAHTVVIDYKLLAITAIAALLGGFVGNKIMHFKLDSHQIKKIIAVLLYVISLKLLSSLI
ncbi:MAG: sulfite exporter TauE/SafE family protein [Epsilonproteobacteria bacterium]|nr:sulfite exporter TauE/SafE family protein [Campylobacterota bacterium]